MAIIDNLGGGMGASEKEQLQAIYDKVIKEHMVDLPFTKVSNTQLDCDSTGYDYLVLTYNLYNTGDVPYFIDKKNFVSPIVMRAGNSNTGKTKNVTSVSDSAIFLTSNDTENWFTPVSIKGIL